MRITPPVLNTTVQFGQKKKNRRQAFQTHLKTHEAAGTTSKKLEKGKQRWQKPGQDSHSKHIPLAERGGTKLSTGQTIRVDAQGNLRELEDLDRGIAGGIIVGELHNSPIATEAEIAVGDYFICDMLGIPICRSRLKPVS